MVSQLVGGDARQSTNRNFEMLRKNSFSKLSGALSRHTNYGQDDTNTVATGTTKLVDLMGQYTPADCKTIQQNLVRHIEYSLARNRWNCDEEAMYKAAALSIRDRMLENFNDTNAAFFKVDPKRTYYLSLEFLVGRAMQNALVNMDIEKNYNTSLKEVGFNLETLYEYEHDSALGNGGLGRLAACYMDSCATMNLPVWGYGIRYTYGIFEQKIIQGRQVEVPDYWLTNSNPWEIERPDVNYAVRFGGHVEQYTDTEGRNRYKWAGGSVVQAEAYDNPIPGFDTANCISIRLWRARPASEFDFHAFNQGDYLNAVSERQSAEAISAVLYPNDTKKSGKELRLKQQYFFVCATIQDVLRRFKKITDRKWSDIPEKMSIQLNDTHPTIAIPEMMRILVDVEGLEWDFAWDLCKQIFNYTNHTVLSEALEKWDASLIEELLPRHLLIINDINFRFIEDARRLFNDDWSKISRMSIYEDCGDRKLIRMANLAVICCKKVNGVAAIHTGLVKRDLFPDFVEYFEKKGEESKFVNVTNGVTVRRWLHNANRKLSDLISNTLGSDEWLKDLQLVQGLENHTEDEDFCNKWREVKLWNKTRLAKWIHVNCKEVVPTDFLFDVQVKRIHEYKRQMMFNFWMIYRYLQLKSMSPADRTNVVKRCSMIGGKAAPGYHLAKSIIKMTNNIGNLVNNDADVSPYFKVVFLPNYNVSSAAIIIPGSDLNEQISTAGQEASGTGNMKFVMNASVIVGTMDGATVEIAEEIGDENVFIFGAAETETDGIRKRAAKGDYKVGKELSTVFQSLKDGVFSDGDSTTHKEFMEIINNLTRCGDGHIGDRYLLVHDFSSYCAAQERVDATYKDQEKWTEMAVRGVAGMGKFSSDRSIMDYCSDIWGIVPVDVRNVADKYAEANKSSPTRRTSLK